MKNFCKKNNNCFWILTLSSIFVLFFHLINDYYKEIFLFRIQIFTLFLFFGIIIFFIAKKIVMFQENKKIALESYEMAKNKIKEQTDKLEQAYYLLKEQEQFREIILESIDNGILAIDEEENILFANNVFYEMWQNPDLKISNDKTKIIEHIINQTINFEEYLKISDYSPTYIDELKLINGKFFECFTRPLVTREGNVIGQIFSFKDKTEKKLYEEKFLESELEKIAIFNSTTELMIYHDVDLKIKWINKAGINAYGRPEDEIIGSYCYKICHHRRTPCKNCPTLRAINTGEIHISEITDFKGYTWLTTGIPIKDKYGNIKGALETNLDITKQKQIENSLIEAKELAEQASKAKSDFLANMSHEIRTPMNGVLGFIQILSETKLDKDQEDYINEIKKSSEVLLNVINDILDFSKIEAGMLSLNKSQFNLRSCIEDTISLYSYIAYQKNIEINALIQSNIPQSVIGDSGRLKQILNNLVNNSIKFTDNGEIFIETSLKSEEDDKVFIEFIVTDTGCGISQEKLNVIFESFYQVDTSSTRKFGGTGLGLAISKKLVEMMDGDICVESKEGKGTKFTLVLGFEKTIEKQIFYKNVSEIKGKRILIADDNCTNLKILKIYLEEEGCIIYETNKPSEVMQLLLNNNIDAAVIDFNMPDMNGLDLAKEIKKNKNTENIPLILLTSFALRGDANSAKEVGFSGYLTKPIKKKDLLNSIFMVLSISEKHGNESSFITKHNAKEQEFYNKFKILLVEDDKTNQKVALKMLNNLGFYCDISDNGEKALEAFKKNHYDLIFMDCQMPVMNGYESTKLIRMHEKENNINQIPIVALTAHALESDDKKCFDAGMSDYLTKPINKDKLVSVLNKYLSSEKTNEEISSNDEIIKGINQFMNKTGFSESETKEIFKEFFSSFSEKVSDLIKTVNNKDFNGLSEKTHKLKGSFLNLYLTECGELTISLEEKANKKNWDECIEIITKLNEIVKSFTLD